MPAKQTTYELPFLFRILFVYIEPLINLSVIPFLLFSPKSFLLSLVPLALHKFDAPTLDQLTTNPFARYLTLMFATMMMLFGLSQHLICKYSVSPRQIVVLMIFVLVGDCVHVWATVETNELLSPETELASVAVAWVGIIIVLVLACARIWWLVEIVTWKKEEKAEKKE